VKLGLANSRMKDFYDLVILARTFPFTGSVLHDAITATCTRRGTTIPSAPPIALTVEFAADDTKRKQWLAFRKRNGLEETIGDLEAVIAELAVFLTPLLAAVSHGEAFKATWKAGGPWDASV
jgi:Nucleotidyl transferase AbiEii toxin, Type IV TA system